MNTTEKLARRRLSLLELAKELRNVSKACQVMGFSRQQFDEIRRNYQTDGSSRLLDRLSGCKGPPPNRLPSDIEQAIVDYSLDTLHVARYGSPKNWFCVALPLAQVAYEGVGVGVICCPNTAGLSNWK